MEKMSTPVVPLMRVDFEYEKKEGEPLLQILAAHEDKVALGQLLRIEQEFRRVVFLRVDDYIYKQPTDTEKTHRKWVEIRSEGNEDAQRLEEYGDD